MVDALILHREDLSPRWGFLLLLLVLALGAALRFGSLGRHGLWVDEGYTARLTEPVVVDATAENTSPTVEGVTTAIA